MMMMMILLLLVAFWSPRLAKNPVAVGPGHSARMRTPLPRWPPRHG
jgi:hypothetical protein